MTKRFLLIIGATIFLSITGLADRGEGASIVIPDVGEGQCVKPGPDGKPQPCGQESQRSLPTTPRTSRTTKTNRQSSVVPSLSDRPCNQVSWDNNQKRQCANRVQTECKKRHTEGTQEFQQCVFKGLTGEGKIQKTKVQESKKKKVHEKEKREQQSSKKNDKPRTGLPTTPSSRKKPRVIEVPASQTPSSPSTARPSTIEETSPPPSPPPPPPPTEQCIFPFYPDCRGQCAGLPSYPTYEFEDCLTRCDQTYQAALEEYNRCQEKQK